MTVAEKACERAVDALPGLKPESQRVVEYAVGQILYGGREDADVADLVSTINRRLA